MSCNAKTQETGAASDVLFQSLSGFPMSCNVGVALGYQPSLAVSIPIGFSNELQPTRRYVHVNPDGFQSLSGFPMSCNVIIMSELAFGYLFQSLSGFPMSCNVLRRRIRARGRPGFNPYRVFQ